MIRSQSLSANITMDARSTYRLAEANSRNAQRRTSVSLSIEMQDQIASHLVRAGSNWSHAELYFRAMLVTCHDDRRLVVLTRGPIVFHARGS